MTSLNSGTQFIENLKSYHGHEAIIWHNMSYSYRDLIANTNDWRKKLSHILPGSIVVLESDFSPHTIAILLVLIELNAIIVPLDINHRNKNFEKTDIVQPDYFITINNEENIELTRLEQYPQKNALYQTIRDRGVAGLVLFTSGSSGKPKGALHDFSKLLAKFEVKRKALRTVNFLLFDHWGGLNTLFHILSNGGTVVILENRTPDYVCEMIARYNVELLPTSPTFLNMMVMSRAYERYDLKSLKVISYGAEPMPASLLEHINRLFPEVKLQQTYGLIELGVMRSQSEENGSLWVKIGGEGYSVRVVDNMLQIKSESAMVGYLNAPSPFTEDGWFVTGDAVEVKGDYFKILGRKSEMINVGGEKVFPQEVENVILEDKNVLDVLVYAEDNRLTGKIVCAKIKYNTDEPKSEIIKRIKKHCRARLQSFKVPVKIELVEGTFESGRFKKNRIHGT
jgi:long-chain acyl-CoA synthetase